MLKQDSKFRFIYDWNDVRKVVDSLIPTITGLVNQEREERRKVEAKLNMLSFGCDPERDKHIIELNKNGLSKTKIARELGMSRQGLYKAIKRLNVS